MSKAVTTKRVDYSDAGAEQGRKDAGEISAAIEKYGADQAHNAQAARQVQRKAKMRAAGLSDGQIESWSDAHADAFAARLEEINNTAGPKVPTSSAVSKL